jgi:hypothetical protein
VEGLDFLFVGRLGFDFEICFAGSARFALPRLPAEGFATPAIAPTTTVRVFEVALGALNGRILAELAEPDFLPLDLALMLVLIAPRTQLKVLAAAISSITMERMSLFDSFKIHTTLASFPFTQRARLCFFISETIDGVSPTQLTT